MPEWKSAMIRSQEELAKTSSGYLMLLAVLVLLGLSVWAFVKFIGAKLVMGAVTMVEMALQKLSEDEVIHLDDERRATMVSNLMVVLCGEREVNPVLNAGTLYQ